MGVSKKSVPKSGQGKNEKGQEGKVEGKVTIAKKKPLTRRVVTVKRVERVQGKPALKKISATVKSTVVKKKGTDKVEKLGDSKLSLKKSSSAKGVLKIAESRVSTGPKEGVKTKIVRAPEKNRISGVTPKEDPFYQRTSAAIASSSARPVTPPRNDSDDRERQAQLLEIKELLAEKRRKILQQLEGIEKESNIGDQLTGDSVDYASIEIAQNALSKTGVRLEKLLNKIDHALKKFDDNSYGVCELTGEDIPIERLRVRPEAQYTVEAKEELERRERLYASNNSDDEDDDESWGMDEEE
jgi:DnaK suppressor protein